jgi:anti-repressor protein
MTNNSQVTKKNSNLWDGKFKEKELKLYSSLNEKDNALIEKYQKVLPILQEENITQVDGRILHKQMKVEKAFTTWIKSNLENIDAEENIDYFQKWIDDKGVSFKGSLENTSVTDLTGKGYKMQYLLTTECAKEIAMITGATPRMNKETKEISKMVRKYFIAIEKAFKERVEWNKDRMGSIKEYYNLREVIFKDLYGDNYLGA